MKPRQLLSAGEIEALHASIDRALNSISLPTQPQVATKILALAGDTAAGLRDYAEVVKTDPALTGRLLRIANSAFFAQRQPVTAIERACVLLGAERLKAVSLGFYLARAAAADPNAVLSRRIWGESVYRACLAAELARRVCPALAAEAFVVGLMLDAGLPIMGRLLGDRATAILARGEPPTRHFHAESATLAYTHVDVIAVLCRRWKLPDLLVKPISWHHVRPPDQAPSGPAAQLHRLAFYVGALQLEIGAGQSAQAKPAPLTAARLLGLDAAELGSMLGRASREYEVLSSLFRDVADGMSDLDSMAEEVHRQLVEVVDQELMQQVHDQTASAPELFTLGGQTIEIQRQTPGRFVAFLRDQGGARLLSFGFSAGQSADEVLHGLGIDDAPASHADELNTYLKSLAA